MLVEIHIIQNHSPANLNRDDLGAPKTCLFGGVTRARISSQCLKRSIRNPGNPEDVHSKGPGMFYEAMSGHIGTKTKFFPWLVQQELLKSQIPSDEHRRIVLRAQRIAVSKEKEDTKAPRAAKVDERPKTAQLIHLGPGHARFFVQKLGELREQQQDCYKYFLNPVVGFQEMVREHLSESGLDDDKEQDRLVNVSWVIAKCRMRELLKPAEGEEPPGEPEMEDNQPGYPHALLIAERLLSLRVADPARFKELIKGPAKEEKGVLKDDAPPKPGKKEWDTFQEALRSANRCDAVDIALFGRMTTSDAFQDVEAAMQVAHAISTHAVVNEVDYFTAVDDLGRTGGGAGHVDEAMFNSACFYKYFCLDWDQLVNNLAGPQPDRENDPEVTKKWENEVKPQAERLAACTVGHFLRAAAQTTPSGKQNGLASPTLPEGILVEIKKSGKIPVSYANAFADPARKIGDPPDDAADSVSLVGRSIAQFGDYVHSLRNAFGVKSTLLWFSPQLWRHPLQGWEREPDGTKKNHMDLTTGVYKTLVGEDGNPAGLVEAMVKEIGFEWSQVKDAGKAPEGA
ncbi:MAG: type I-E CRISPR-associated protein Cas7/Cse4/CasC [Chloroflexi bacterium]|nr:type I-E CRISPR-associated protein Cas7/Cse4/CasC [Chloroflexota bacterium]